MKASSVQSSLSQICLILGFLSVLGLLQQPALSAGPASQPSTRPATLRILTYNIQHGAGTDQKVDLERQAKVILSANPDLVALQEVDQGTTRVGKVLVADKLAELTHLKSAFGKSMPFAGGEYGNAILSRFEITATKTHLLKSAPKEEPRSVLVTTIRLPDGSALTFAVTHLNHRLPAERLEQAKQAAELTVGDGRTPAILAGDLNAEPNSQPLAAVGQLFTDATSDPALLSYPAPKPTKKIDYILFAPKNGWKVVEAKVLDEPAASDHRPVLVVLERQSGK